MIAEMERNFIKGCHRVIVKVGSAILTSQAGLDLVRVHQISDQIAELAGVGVEVVLVSSGAVAAGVRCLGREEAPQTIPEKQAAAAIGQSLLMQAWEEGCRKHGLHIAQVLLTGEDVGDPKRYENARRTLQMLLSWKVLPVINENDTVAVDEIKFGDNDQLAALIAGVVDADLVVLLTDIDGLFDADPRVHTDAHLLHHITNIDASLLAMTEGEGGRWGTGGMRSKVLAAKRCTEQGIPMLVARGNDKDILLRLWRGEKVGTLFVPPEKR